MCLGLGNTTEWLGLGKAIILILIKAIRTRKNKSKKIKMHQSISWLTGHYH